MPIVEASTTVKAPIYTTYRSWAGHDADPQLMDGIQEVTRTGERTLHWRADLFGASHEWDAEIVEEVPNSHITWHSLSGPYIGGTVSFHSLDESRTSVRVQFIYEPNEVSASNPDAAIMRDDQIERDLDSAKDKAEAIPAVADERPAGTRF